MKKLLVSDAYPHGHDFGSVLDGIRTEILKGSHRITHDGNPETRHLMGTVLDCHAKVMKLLSQAGKMVETMGLVSAGNLGAPVLVPLSAPIPINRRIARR
jgi:hypothetical protein